MSKQYSIAEAKAKLPGIVRQVEESGPVEITRRGKPVAVVLSLEEYRRISSRRLTLAEVGERYRARTQGEDYADGVWDDVRDKDPGRESPF